MMLTYLCQLGPGSNNDNDTRPRTNFLIEGKSINGLFDSGSSVTLVNWATYLHLRRPGMKLKETKNVLKTASGEELRVRGQVNLSFTFGKRVCIRPTIVVEGLKSQVIIGNDTMRTEGFILDPARQRITIRPPSNEFPVLIKKAYSIDAESEQLIECIFDTTTDLTDMDLLTTEDFIDPVLHQSLEVVEGLFRGNASRNGSLVIANVSSEPVYIPKRTQIGTVKTAGGYELIELIDETEEMINQSVMRKPPSVTSNDIDLSHIPVPYRSAYLGLMNKYRDIFAWKPGEVGDADIVKQSIILKDPNSVASIPPYRLNPNLRVIAEKYVEKLLATGVIRKSTSPFSSPLMLVKKANADEKKPMEENWRVVHDFRRLNGLTVRDAYPLQNIHDLIDSVAQAELWSVIDLSNGFWNQSLEEDSKAKTAFGLPGIGHFEYQKSAQGLANSPAAFQRLLDYILRGLKRTYCYIDDVVIASNSHAQHLVDLDELFSKFRKYKMKIRVSKIQLATREINYLGYNISKTHGIRAGLGKTHAIEAWTPPKDVTQIKQFLGLCGFFRKTLKNFSNIALPLNQLTRKTSKWKSGDMPPDAVTAFNSLKAALCKRPCLAPVDFSKPFIITCDASTTCGLGAVLTQEHDGIEHPCGFASRSLTDPEKKYSPYHLEKMAILWAIKHFRNYVYGKHFTVRSDHKPLLAINNLSGCMLERIRTELMEFEPFTVKYIPGPKNPADGLSRNPIPDKDQIIFEITHDGEAKSAETWGASLNWSQIFHLQKEDPGLKAICIFLKFGSRPTNALLNEFINKYIAKCKLIDGVVCYETSNWTNKERNKYLVFAPKGLIPTLLTLAHDNPLAGHFASAKTFQRLRTQWHWDGMQSDVQNYCNSCVICSQTNIRHSNAPAPLESLPPADKFGFRVHIDLLGPLPLSAKSNCKYLLVMTDAFTNLLVLAPLINKTADVVAKGILDCWVSQHGCPSILASDKGSEFVAGVLKELCTKMNIKQRFSSTAHPQSNGRVERFNRVILAYYQKYLETNPQWEELLPAIQFSYNSTPHIGTGYSPFFKAYMRRPVVPSSLLTPVKSYSEMESVQTFSLLQQVYSQIGDLQQDAFEKQKSQFDHRSKVRDFIEGDMVFATQSKKAGKFQKFQRPYAGPYIITKVLPHNNVIIWEEGAKKSFQVHTNRIKLCTQRTQNLKLTGVDNDNEDAEDAAVTSPVDPARRTIDAFAHSQPPTLADDDDLPQIGIPLLQPDDHAHPPAPVAHDVHEDNDDDDDVDEDDDVQGARALPIHPVRPERPPQPRIPPTLSRQQLTRASEADILRQVPRPGTGTIPKRGKPIPPTDRLTRHDAKAKGVVIPPPDPRYPFAPPSLPEADARKEAKRKKKETEAASRPGSSAR